MRKLTLINVISAAAGGITGLLVYFSFFGPVSGAYRPLAAAGLIAGFSVLSAVLLLALSTVFSYHFGKNLEKEMSINARIFSIPVLSGLALPVYMKLHAKLSALAPSVLGNVYIPFHGYEHLDMAGYFLICAAAGAWLAVFFITALRFIVSTFTAASGQDKNKIQKTVFWFALIFYLLATSLITLIYPPTGDEPHYLVTAASISSDFDLDLENNYTDQKQLSRFYPGDLDYKNLHTVKVHGRPGVYTSHDMGLPFLLVPFVKAGGRYAVQLFMNFLAALMCAALYMMLSRLGLSLAVSSAAAMTAAICMPVMAGASLVLTEVPAAAIIAYSFYILSDTSRKNENLLFFSLLAFMPWLHLKLIIFPAVFYIYYYYLAFRNKNFVLKTELINNIPVLLSAAAYLVFYYAVYGIIAPFGVKELHENIYAADPSTQMNTFVLHPLHFIISGLASIFDRDYGLITYCLLYAASFWGIFHAFHKKQPALLTPLFLMLPYIIIFLLWKDWTGSMTPARQLVPAVPIMVLYAAYFTESSGFYKTRLFRLFTGISVFTSWLLAAVPLLRYGASKEKIFAFISAHAPRQVLWLLPPFRDSIAAGTVISLIYLAVIISAYYFYRHANSKTA